MKHKQDGFSHVLLFVFIIIIGVVGFAGYRVYDKQENKNISVLENGQPLRFADENGRAPIPEDCVGKELKFARDIVAPEDRSRITGVGGIGGVNVPTHIIPSDHGGTGMVNRSTTKTAIYLPTTATLFTANFEPHAQGGTNGAMYFRICGDVDTGGISFHFGHLSEIAPDVAKQMGCESVTQCQWGTMSGQEFEPLELQEGTIVAYVGGVNADPAAGFDIGVLDINNQVDLPGGFEVWGTHGHAQCPYDYFTDADTKNHYYDLLKFNHLREPYCGTMNLYVEGTLAGVWFDPDTDWPTLGAEEYKHASFGQSNASNNRDFFMNATVNPDGGGYYEVKNSGQVNRAVKDITSDGNKYCIEKFYNHPKAKRDDELMKGIVFLQMTTATDLIAEHAPQYDRCPINVNDFSFGDSAKKFERFKKDWKFTDGF